MKYLFNTKDNQAVIYLDICGFSTIVGNNDKENQSVDDYICDFDKINSFLYKALDSVSQQKKCNFCWISDSIVLSSDIENIDLLIDLMFETICRLKGAHLLLKGGIAVGRLNWSSVNIIGEAFCRAVDIEDKVKDICIGITPKDLDKFESADCFKYFDKKTNGYFLFNDLRYCLDKNKENLKTLLTQYVNIIVEQKVSLIAKQDTELSRRYCVLIDKLISFNDEYDLSDLIGVNCSSCETKKSDINCKLCEIDFYELKNTKEKLSKICN